MVDRKSKYSASVRDKPPTTAATARNFQDNFATEFSKYSEEYNVHPLPRVIIKSIVDIYVARTEDDGSPIFYLTYDKKKLDIVKEIESKGREVSICILDALNSTMQKYNTITVLELPDCRINAFGIVLIAEMLITVGCVRDLNLDMNPNAQENFHLLCTPAGNLEYLSLSLCKISDNGIKKIMDELKYQDGPNESKLTILNLANNHIENDGAVHIASTLRTNRSLKCLSLLRNRISDEGASMILQELKITTLTHEEVMDLRRRKFAELMLLDQLMEKEKDEEMDKSINEELSKKSSKTRTRHSLTRRSKKSRQDSSSKLEDEDSLYQISESTRKKEAIVGNNKRHPFQNESFPINGKMVATGNLELQYLDLSYNYLSKTTLEELIECLYYQNYMLGKDKTKGLLNVLLEGEGIEQENNADWITFEDLLQIRREGKSFTDDTFREFVSGECEILRRNIQH